MSHIYINECIGDTKDAYLIHYGDTTGARELRLGITEHFTQAWDHNPRLQKFSKPNQFEVTTKEIKGWLQDCEAGHIYTLPVLRLKPDDTVFLWYLSYAPDVNGETLQKRISQLCDMSNEIQDITETRECYLNVPSEYEDKDAWLDAKDAEYQHLFTETINLYA